MKIDRKGQNNKELTVRRGELIEIENSSKKWWRARNFHGDVGHVPHNIVEEIEIEQRPIVCRKICLPSLLIENIEKKKQFFFLLISILENYTVESVRYKFASCSNKHH